MPHPPTTNRVKGSGLVTASMAAGDRKRGWGPHEFVACAPDLAAGHELGRYLGRKWAAAEVAVLRRPWHGIGQATVDLQSVWAMTPFSKMDTNLRCQSYPAARRNAVVGIHTPL
uniref:Uncharacterized protein n=1 Tax=Oryza nivara TaxID=4536 RepID=A0A0E0HZP8_ORYNI